MTEVKSRKLGRRQSEALALLKQHGTYFKKCGWKYNSHSETVEILESLVPKGYVKSSVNDDQTFVYEFVSEPENAPELVAEAETSTEASTEEPTSRPSDEIPPIVAENAGDTAQEQSPDASAVEGGYVSV